MSLKQHRPHNFKGLAEQSRSFVQQLYQHRFVLVRIWDEIHDDETDLLELIKGLLERFSLKGRHCDYCMYQSTEPLNHYVLPILLCKLAGKRCRNLEFYYADEDKKQPMGYYLTVRGEHSFHSGTPAESSSSTNEEKPITSSEALKLLLKHHHPKLFEIVEHFGEMTRTKISTRKKKAAPTEHSAGP